VKTAKYRKRCFDQIQGISEDNKLLTAEVERLCKWLKTTKKDREELESQKLSAIQAWAERAGSTDMPPGACYRPRGGDHKASSGKYAYGRGVCTIISREDSVGGGPRTTPRPGNEHH
jgi:hypothetical protein